MCSAKGNNFCCKVLRGLLVARIPLFTSTWLKSGSTQPSINGRTAKSQRESHQAVGVSVSPCYITGKRDTSSQISLSVPLAPKFRTYVAHVVPLVSTPQPLFAIIWINTHHADTFNSRYCSEKVYVYLRQHFKSQFLITETCCKLQRQSHGVSVVFGTLKGLCVSITKFKQFLFYL